MMAYPETGPLNPLMAEINKEINPVSLSNLLFKQHVMSSPGLTRSSSQTSMKRGEACVGARLSPCVTMCFSVCPLAVSSFSNFSFSLYVSECAAQFSLPCLLLGSLGRLLGHALTRHAPGSDSCTSLCRYHRQFLYFEWQSSCAGSSPSFNPSHSFVR